MSQLTAPTPAPVRTEGFVDRRNAQPSESETFDRRQFGSSHEGLTPDARELAMAMDKYKLRNRRRFVSFEEILEVVKQLGYSR